MNLQTFGLLLLAIVEFAVVVWAIVDAARRPSWAWKRAGQNKIVWVALQPGGFDLHDWAHHSGSLLRLHPA